MEPIGSLKLFTDEAGVAAETPLQAAAGRAHEAVVEHFLGQVAQRYGGDNGAAAAEVARVIDACYRSAEARREIGLS